jgi:hypothetical protein
MIAWQSFNEDGDASSHKKTVLGGVYAVKCENKWKGAVGIRVVSKSLMRHESIAHGRRSFEVVAFNDGMHNFSKQN